MILTDFPQSNTVIDKPSSMTRDECEPANAFVGVDTDGKPVIITCWKLTVEEKEELLRTGRIWCYHFGTSLQPHALGCNNPFGES